MQSITGKSPQAKVARLAVVIQSAHSRPNVTNSTANANVVKVLVDENAINVVLITGVIHPTILADLVFAINWDPPPNSVTMQQAPAYACRVWVARNVTVVLVDTSGEWFRTVNHAANVSTTGIAFFRYFCIINKMRIISKLLVLLFVGVARTNRTSGGGCRTNPRDWSNWSLHSRI